MLKINAIVCYMRESSGTVLFFMQHDNGASCVAKNDEEGNYIMFASATSGDLPNNNRFSTCSLTNITLVSLKQ